jgi:hypothetical protein
MSDAVMASTKDLLFLGVAEMDTNDLLELASTSDVCQASNKTCVFCASPGELFGWWLYL